ncbi:hypothetical protein SAMN04487897_11667 [Paenibacillus sp. yr247]|uniref:hypothetical protein n=1 Tax=Paenibacillus sp. yr247 TaxID=1761880 RepID=UPI000889F968|nr:hypothetical protein [Paenibacillus sp. yr247]SDO54028.1 hypothetical protein SAMN04487897_11667 [Paenibacillus sp. yr247]
MSEKIVQKGDRNLALVNSSVSIIEESAELQRFLSEGRLIEAAALFQRMMKAASAQHPVFPHWRYDLKMDESGKVIIGHVPANQEVAESHPFKINIKFDMPEKYRNFPSMNELLLHSYGKQEEIELDVISFKAWIGEEIITDDQSSDAHSIKINIKPQEFPKPLPMKLYMLDNSFTLDYLEVGVTEIYNNTVTLENHAQRNVKMRIQFRINLIDKSSGFSIKIAPEYYYDVEANLLLLQFMKSCRDGSRFVLKVLNKGTNLFVSREFSLDVDIPEDIDNKIECLHDLYKMEEHYKVKFLLKEVITEDDQEKLTILKLVAEDKPLEGTYDWFDCKFSDRQTIENTIAAYENQPNGLLMVVSEYNHRVSVLGAEVLFEEVKREISNAIPNDIEKLRKKVSLMEDGESINIRFIPATEENKIVERYVFRSIACED